MPKKLTIEEFIEKVKSMPYDDIVSYDIENIEYLDDRIPLSIICPFHGLYLQTSENN